MEYTLYLWSVEGSSGLGVCKSCNYTDTTNVSQIKFVGTFTQLYELVFLLMDKFPEQYPTTREAVIEANSLWEGLLYKGE